MCSVRLGCYADNIRGSFNAFDVNSALALMRYTSHPHSDVDE